MHAGRLHVVRTGAARSAPDAAQGLERPEAHGGVVGAGDQEGGPHRQRQHRLVVALQHAHAVQRVDVPHPAAAQPSLLRPAPRHLTASKSRGE